MNYPNFQNNLNVIRVEDLINDIYKVYTGDAEMCFFSADIVSMFDRICMKETVNILKNDFGCHIPGGYINVERLLELISLDTDLFDSFRFFEPTITKDRKPRYFHQRIGIPMGGNTSNVYADLYVSFCLSRISSKLKQLGVLLIRKYVDDLLFYGPKKNVKAILVLLKQCTKLDFTCEMPVKGVLPYLDVTLNDVRGELRTSWYVYYKGIK